MLRYMLVFCILIALCYCDGGPVYVDVKKKPYHHHHGHHYLWYGGPFLYYLTFLAIKVKLVLVLGSIFVFMLFMGKLYALIKYTDCARDKNHHDHHEPEKIYIQAPSHHDFRHSEGPFLDSPPNFHSGSYHSPDVDKFVMDFDDKSPAGAELWKPNYKRISHSYYPGYKRSNGDGYSLYDGWAKLGRTIRKLNITGLAFDVMKIKNEDCRRKLICQVESDAKHSYLLRTALDVLSDEVYEKYKVTENIDNTDGCHKNYPKCIKFDQKENGD